jgi:hypothetical protein
MFHEGENRRLCVHAAHTEPVLPSSSVAVLGTPPENLALYRRARARAVPVPAVTDRYAMHAARRGIAAHASAPAEGVAIRALTASIISIGRHPPCLMRN